MVKKKLDDFLKKLKDRHEKEKEKKLVEEEGNTGNAIISKKRKKVSRVNNHQEVEKASKLKLEMDASKAKEANPPVPEFMMNSNVLTDLCETYKDEED